MNDLEGSNKKPPWSEINVTVISVCNRIRFLVSYVSCRIVIFCILLHPYWGEAFSGEMDTGNRSSRPVIRILEAGKKIDESFVALIGLLFLWLLLLFDFVKATTAIIQVAAYNKKCCWCAQCWVVTSPHCLPICDCLTCHMTGCVALLKSLFAFMFRSTTTGCTSLSPQPLPSLLFWRFSPSDYIHKST